MCFLIGHNILSGTSGEEEDSFITCTTISRIKEQCFQSNTVNCSPPSGANCFESDNSWTKFY